jgi:hypothetical protein
VASNDREEGLRFDYFNVGVVQDRYMPKEKVLVVDDEPTIRWLLKEALHKIFPSSMSSD